MFFETLANGETRVESFEHFHALVISAFGCCALVISAFHFCAPTPWFHFHVMPFLYNFIVVLCLCDLHSLALRFSSRGEKRYACKFFLWIFVFLVNIYVFIFSSRHVSIYIVKEISFKVLITYYLTIEKWSSCIHIAELRDPHARLPNGSRLPPLFNFSPQELIFTSASPELIARLLPHHIGKPNLVL